MMHDDPEKMKKEIARLKLASEIQKLDSEIDRANMKKKDIENELLRLNLSETEYDGLDKKSSQKLLKG